MECPVANCANGFIDDNATACPTCNGAGRIYPLSIRWRLNDPAEEQAERWTKVHRTQTGRKTFCGITIPELPYMADEDEQIPAAVPSCTRCQR